MKNQDSPYNYRQSAIARMSLAGGMNSMLFITQGDNNPEQFKIAGTKDTPQNVTSIKEFDADDENFHETIEVSSLFAWTILFINCIFSAFVPCWLMGDVRSESFTRNSWRYLTVSFLLLPFMIYEQRNNKNQSQKLLNCLTKQNLKPIFISTVNFCIWLGLLIYACRWTSLNHSVSLTALRIFIITLIKFKKGEKLHEFEVAGGMLSALGVILILTDSITLPQVYDLEAEKYLRVEPWKRLILGDGLAILGSIASYYLDQNHQVPEMPRFTYLYVYNLFLTFNLITFGYFFGGNQFSFNPKYGVFGLYTYQNFVSVFYVSIMLGLTLILSNILITQIFSELIINVTCCFQFTITAMIYHVLALELIPSGMTCLGYAFLTPGLVFCVGGQGALQNLENKLNFEVYRPSNRETRIRETYRETNKASDGPKRSWLNLQNSASRKDSKLHEIHQQEERLSNDHK